MVVDVEVVAILNFGLVGFRSAETALVNRIPEIEKKIFDIRW